MRQNPHVRICGGPGSATTLVYPTPRRCDATSSGLTRPRRCEYRQTTVQEPWGGTA